MNGWQGLCVDKFPGDSLKSLWGEFCRQFPDEEACLDAIFKFASKNNFLSCPYCFHTILERTKSSRNLCCRNCHKRSSLTTRTIFERSRRVRPLFALIWLTSMGGRFSSSRIREFIGIAQSTALTLMKKVSIVLESMIPTSGSLVHESLFQTLICKRSRATGSNLHPRTDLDSGVSLDMGQSAGEESGSVLLSEPDLGNVKSTEAEPNEGKNGSMTVSVSSRNENQITQQTSPEECLLQMLELRSPLHFDDICSGIGLPAGDVGALLTVLELQDRIRRKAGDFYEIVKEEKRDTVQLSSLGDLSEVEQVYLQTEIRKRHHGVSAKYLQLYLALVSYLAGEQGHSTTGDLLDNCLRYGKVTCGTISEISYSPWMKMFGLAKKCPAS